MRSDQKAYIQQSTIEGLEGRVFLSGYTAVNLNLKLAGGLNDLGAVAGVIPGKDETNAVLRAADGTARYIGALPGSDSVIAKSVNSFGDVAGYGAPPYGRHAFLWHDGKLSSLIESQNYYSSEANGMNDAGAVVGFVTSYDASVNAGVDSVALWQHKRLQIINPGTHGDAMDINNAGAIVGEFVEGPDGPHPFIYADAKITELPLMPGEEKGTAFAINESNQVVGIQWSKDPGANPSPALLWTNGKVQSLGTLPGCVLAEAYDINDDGVVVGESGVGDVRHAFVWTASSKMVDLNSYFPGAPFTLTQAINVNNNGQILAIAVTSDNQPTAFLLTPSESGSGVLTPPDSPPPITPVPPPPPTETPTPDPTDPEAPAPSSYTGVDLKLVDASTISDVGKIAAVQSTRNGQAAVVSDLTGRATLVPMLEDASVSMATDVNRVNEIVGDSISPGSDGLHTAFYSRRGKTSELIHRPGDDSRAAAINDQGSIVGSIRHPGEAPMATLWQNRRAIPLGTLGGDSSVAHDISYAGLIVGASNATAGGPAYPFYYRKGQMTQLPLLPGMVSGFASAINEAGQVVGSLFDSSANQRAVIWANKKVALLSPLSGDSSSLVNSINDSGVAVGQSSKGGSSASAVIWLGRKAYDLNLLVGHLNYTLIEAKSIDNAGQIVAIGRNSAGTQHVFLLHAADTAAPSAPALNANSSKAKTSGSPVFSDDGKGLFA